ncbi:hypothetical protein ACN9JG_06195 [Cereibacter azotoformans]
MDRIAKSLEYLALAVILHGCMSMGSPGAGHQIIDARTAELVGEGGR